MMINKNQITPEITKIDNSSSHFFETVRLNVAEYAEPEDSSLSSLYGDKNFTDVNPFIYENEFLIDSKPGIFSEISDRISQISLPVKNIKYGLAGTFALASVFFIGMMFSKTNQSDFVADASPLPQISLQNIESKTSSIKNIVASGEIYSDSDTITYRIKQEDTINKISQKTGISVDTIKLLNGISSDKELQTKEKIVLPVINGNVVKVKQGDTLEVMAVKNSVSTGRIIALNKNHLKNPHYLQIGQPIFVPSDKSTDTKVAVKTENKPTPAKTTDSKISVSRENNIVHKLAAGETIGLLAVRYGISEEKIMAANVNINPTRLQINQRIIIPVNSLKRNGSRSKDLKLASRSLMGGYENGSVKSGRLVWPAYGQFSSPFGWRGREYHRGIDIAASYGTNIVAAMSGYVISAGWDGGYGNMIQIRHYNGMVTRYAHCSKFYVSSGQYVNGGQVIAAIGTSGYATGPHVHFEVMVNGSQVNPRNYL